MKHLVFRQLHDARSRAYTYLLGDRAERSAVLIDPVFDHARRDTALLGELGLTLGQTLDTHIHADHITGAWMLKQLTGSRIALAASANAQGVDVPLRDGDRVTFGARYLEVRATPGHTDSCLSFVLDDQSMAFTGDALLIRGAGRTDFQQGDALTLYRSIKDRILSLPDDCLIYPAHDYDGLSCSSVVEEREFNPQIGAGRSEQDFVDYMQNLGLSPPKHIAAAVPANLECGKTDLAIRALNEPVWAPLRYSYAGLFEIDPDWVVDHLQELQVVDVRGPDEYRGKLGHISGAKLIPLAELGTHLDELDPEAPTVAVCRSGGRAARAVEILEQAGFARVANLSGGMISWHHARLPVER